MRCNEGRAAVRLAQTVVLARGGLNGKTDGVGWLIP